MNRDEGGNDNRIPTDISQARQEYPPFHDRFFAAPESPAQPKTVPGEFADLGPRAGYSWTEADGIAFSLELSRF